MKNLIILMILIASTVFGQGVDGASLGMAGNYMALSRGISAMALNPANLALERENTLELNLFSLNASIFNSSFSINDYNEYFTDEGNNGHWNRSDKEAILDLIPDDGFKLYSDITTNLFGIAYDRFGFSSQIISSSKATMPKKPFEIVLFGEDLSREYLYHDSNFFDVDAYAAMKLSFGYAHLIDIEDYLPGFSDLAVGMNVNYYLGIAVAQSLTSDVLLEKIDSETAKTNLQMEYRTATPESEPFSGGGFGFDLGASAVFDDVWTFSLSFTNVLASINWDKNTEMNVIIESDSTNVYEDSDEDHSVSVDTTYSAGSFKTNLPAKMSMGAAFQMFDNLTLTAEWQQGLNEEFGNSTTPRVGVGAEYFPLKWLPLRTGMAVGGRVGFLYGMGIGLNFSHFRFDYSYAMNKAMWPSSSNGLFTALSMKLLF
ncbi:MAG: DUF5723 family protein [Calditrichaceae bacterium]